MGIELSMNDKIVEAHNLAVTLGDRLNEDTLRVDQAIADMIWGHADGLSAKRLYNIRDGCCSLQASIDFDPAEEEAQLDREIGEMQDLIDMGADK